MKSINTFILKIYFFFISNSKRRNIIISHLLKKIKSNDILSDYIYYSSNFKYIFTPEVNSILLEKSLLQKNKLLANHLLDNESLIYPYPKETKKLILDDIITNGLYRKNHISWLFIISLYDVLSLLSLKDTNEIQTTNDNYNTTKKLINHSVFKQFFIDNNIESYIDSLDIPKNISNALLLDIKLPTNNIKRRIVKI